MKIVFLLITAIYASNFPMLDLQASLKVPIWTSNNYCGWAGVYCNSSNEVYAICLTGLPFTGDLAEGIFSRLPKLSILAIVIDDNSQAQALTLPSDLCTLNSLNQLELHRLNINTAFPSQILSCTKLKILHMAYCGLTGTLPDFSNMNNLETLDLNGNKFTGSISQSIANLPNLVTLQLFSNSLSGSLPSFASNNLASLDVRNNALTGSVPSDLFSKSSIDYFGFDGNQMTVPEICKDKPFCIPFS
ncbi:unnamed protein product [Blepharisma stoltei]|uniref:Uncharacterized protein n=1 Tax=Blepharisma stoltei TaxID=1481888 RepID=A0AAU9IVC7_9CILI|nr:unnamed protein product [Blepharisma stoltei]